MFNVVGASREDVGWIAHNCHVSLGLQSVDGVLVEGVREQDGAALHGVREFVEYFRHQLAKLSQLESQQ